MLPAKKSLNALCEKRLQSSMFKWTSFYNFLEFHCKILNSYVIYRCKKMVKILNCYLYAKKSYGTLSKGAIFFANPVDGSLPANPVNDRRKANAVTLKSTFCLL